jgi:predicted RNase H-like HicB family nuclease
VAKPIDAQAENLDLTPSPGGPYKPRMGTGVRGLEAVISSQQEGRICPFSSWYHLSLQRLVPPVILSAAKDLGLQLPVIHLDCVQVGGRMTMAKKLAKRKTRGRYLTAEEAAKYERIREQVTEEFSGSQHEENGDSTMKAYTAVVERCPDTGLYIGYIPGFPGAHSQGETLDQLNENLREVIAMLLEDGEPRLEAEFLGTQTVTVP